ncbi:hypothetical protein [Nonomuraea rhizosphaerae]|uniref:hypothetical protein n=1 Tax=Nonomuraea rhizosphaerae TaxID=2665663 RepID=UPI001C5E6E15|nr:hypothetical protein [Nonomuraea rhizosphaerae]
MSILTPEARRRVGTLGFVAVEPDEISLVETDVVLVAVSAPTGEQGVDTSCLRAATRTLGEALMRDFRTRYPVIVYRCTVPPGMTRTLTRLLEAVSGLRAGVHFGVAYSPEYLRAATACEDFLRPDVTTVGVIGDDERAWRIVRDLYQRFSCPLVRVSPEGAEFQKYVHNLFNAVKISFFNEMRTTTAHLGIREVDDLFRIAARSAEGMRDPLHGIADLGPYGGSCLPKDAAAWLLEMRRRLIASPMVAAAQTVNHQAISRQTISPQAISGQADSRQVINRQAGQCQVRSR